MLNSLFKEDLINKVGQQAYDEKLAIITKLALKEEAEGKFKPEVDEVDIRTQEQKGELKLHNGFNI